MGRKREVLTYNGALKGKYLDERDCDKLDALLQVWKEGGSVPDLKNLLTNLSPDEVDWVIQNRQPIDEPTLGELRDYQTVAVAYAFFAKRCMLSASVGMGKTAITTGLLNLLQIEKEKENKPFSFLFLTETNTVSQHEREFIRFTNQVIVSSTGEKGKVQKLLKETNELTNPIGIVASHSILSQPIFYEAVDTYRKVYGRNPFDVVIFDESSRVGVATGPFGGVKSKLYKNAQWLVKDIDRIVALNATPFEKNLMTFFGQLSLLDDSMLPTKTAFMDRYVVTAYQGRAWAEPTGEYKHEDEFRDLIRYRYLSQTRKDVGGEIIDSTAELIEVPLTDVQKKLLKTTSMPHMVYDAPWYFNYDDYNIDLDGVSYKTGRLFNEVYEAVQERGNCLVYCHYKEAQYELERFIRDRSPLITEVVNGDMEYKERVEAFNRFSSGVTQVLITNGQKGLNFNNCRDLIFYAPIGNPNMMVQVEGRITRDIDIKDKHVKVIVTEGEEANQFRSSIAKTALSSENFSGADHSLILNLLKKESRNQGNKQKEKPSWVPDKKDSGTVADSRATNGVRFTDSRVLGEHEEILEF